MPLYCTTEAVGKLLPDNVIIEGENPDNNPFDRNAENTLIEDVEYFIKQAASEIDGTLGTIYDVPFKKTIVDDSLDYPAIISRLCAVLAAGLIYDQKLQGADSQSSDAQKKREDWAREELTLIQNGERRLQAQRATRSDRFVRNTIRNAPRNPAKDGKSDGTRGR